MVKAPKTTLKLGRKKKHIYVLRVTMPTTVANACQGARFKLTLKSARDPLTRGRLSAPPVPSSAHHGRRAR